ncbi:MAG: hypothetical protein E7L17_10040 [Clostridium sp.]|uniref:hypothetical protein n=1 Tax=Clostridium sp. TaxID=1506 RepID=UPI00290A72B2|nr:hypothetical protein [Clostridium sp.]MDU7338439.1 hypothetical protein [Clostridium sp.]
MNLPAIQERFLCLSGLSPQEAQPWLGLCDEAMQELHTQVLSEPESAATLLNAAAAALAFYRFTVAQSSGPESEFTAGEVRVTKSLAGMEAARRLWQEARKAASPYLCDTEFYFKQVQS